MVTLTTLRSDLSRALMDTKQRYLQAADLNRLINQAQDQWALDTEALERITVLAVTSGVSYVTPPTDFIRPRAMIYLERWPMKPLGGGIAEFGEQWGWTNYPGLTFKYEMFEGLIRLLPAPSQTSPTTTLSASMSSTDTTATLTSGTNFFTNGFFQVDSEKVEYFGTGTAGNAPANIRRGAAKTTVAAHASGATVTRLDLLIAYYARPAELVNDADVSEVPDRYTHILVSFAAYLAHLDGSEKDLAEKYLQLYRLNMERMVAIARNKNRQQSERVRSIDGQGGIYI